MFAGINLTVESAFQDDGQDLIGTDLGKADRWVQPMVLVKAEQLPHLQSSVLSLTHLLCR